MVLGILSDIKKSVILIPYFGDIIFAITWIIGEL